MYFQDFATKRWGGLSLRLVLFLRDYELCLFLTLTNCIHLTVTLVCNFDHIKLQMCYSLSAFVAFHTAIAGVNTTLLHWKSESTMHSHLLTFVVTLL